MKYKLNSIVAKIKSPVVLLLPMGKRKEFASGTEAAEADFGKHYVISEIVAKDDTVVLTLAETDMPHMNWVGEEATFF